MTPRNTCLVGDARARLGELAPASVDCVITSPPYFLLRNYGVPGQVGLEPDIGAWVRQLLRVMDGIGRVLKPAGSVWLNVGDSYSRHRAYGGPPKSLLLGPERLLVALAAAGWTVRNKVVWAKTNPRPASVTDRLTCTWEPIYLLTKSSDYFFDLDAVRVPRLSSARRPSPWPKPPAGRPPWAGPLSGTQSGLASAKAEGRVGHVLGKNPGDVWRLPASSYRGAHFATFPERLVELPLRATCPEAVCRRCGQAWRRHTAERLGKLAVRGDLRRTCDCRASTQPGLVLDPFFGTGTTGLVAERLERDWLGIELNPAFVALAQTRLAARRDDQDRRAA